MSFDINLNVTFILSFRNLSLECLFSFVIYVCGVISSSGFPVLGVEWQRMENPDLRMSMGMGLELKGVRIRRIEPAGPESHLLKPSDIILSFNGVNISNDGTGEPHLI